MVANPTGPDGRTEVSLPTHVLGERWYFEVTPPPSWPNGPKTMLFHSGRPLTQDTLLPLAMDAISFSNLTDMGPVGNTSAVWHHGKAALLVFARSCENGLAAGLEIRVEASDGGAAGTPLYNGNVSAPCGYASPSCAVTYTAWFSGIEPGPVTVSAWNGSMKIAEEKVVAKADSVTVLNWMYPRSLN